MKFIAAFVGVLVIVGAMSIIAYLAYEALVRPSYGFGIAAMVLFAAVWGIIFTVGYKT